MVRGMYGFRLQVNGWKFNYSVFRTHTIVLVDDKGKMDILEDTMQQPIQVDQPVWRLKKLTSHL